MNQTVETKRIRGFKCPICNKTNGSRKWNSSTAEKYGREIVTIDDTPEMKTASFICPETECETESDGSEITILYRSK